MDIRTPGTQVFRFGVFELDGGSGELRRHGLKVRFPDQSFQILKLLLSRPGEVVTRHELRQALWTADTFVDFEVGLNSAVRKLRDALDDSAENPRFVETVPRHGYRFVASVTRPAGSSPVPPDEATEQRAAQVLEPEPDEASEPPRVVTAAGVTRWHSLRWATTVALVGVIVAVTGVWYQRSGVAVSTPIRSLVVLPFENLTGDAGQGYFVNTVTEAVTAHLAQVGGLDVISSRSARQYEQAGKRIPEMAKELKVEAVIEGTVAKLDGRPRITVKLVSAATDKNVWVRIYEGEVGEMLRLQQQIASDLAVAVGRPPPAARLPTRVVKATAYEAYVKGLSAKGLERAHAFQRAVAYFEEAVAIQPDFAEAYAELALVQVQFLYGGPYSPHQVVPKAEAAARRALELDDTLSRAQRALGLILNLYYWRWGEGDEMLARASAPNGDESPLPVSNSLIRRGQVQEAVAVAERARKLDPLSVNAQIAVGTAYRAAGQYDRSILELRRALAMSPGRDRVNFQIGVTLLMMGRFDDAIREIQIGARPATGHNSRHEAYLGYAYAVAGRTHEARAILQELDDHRRDQYVSWYGVGLIHDALGDKTPALAAVQRAFEDHAVEFGLMNQYPPFKTIAGEPAFQSIMRRVRP